MKFLVSYMFRVSEYATNYGYQELIMDYWDTAGAVEAISNARGLEASATIIITSVFQIPESRFSKEEKAYLKDWMQLAYEHIESDDEIQGGIIKSMIKELNE